MLSNAISSRSTVMGINHLFLIDPVVLSHLPALDLLLVEPQSDLLLRRLNCVGPVANIAANVLQSVSQLSESC